MTLDGEEQQSPFTRPGFIAATIVLAVIVVLGVVIAIANSNRLDLSDAAGPTTARGGNSSPSDTETATAPAIGGASVCGLAGEKLTGSLTSAPPAEWLFQDTTAYPISTTFGPGATSPDGVRSCFQHSPEGAVFAAANAVVQGSDPSRIGSWLDYFVAAGPHRDEVLEPGPSSDDAVQGVRVEVAGFRLLAYDGQSARVDVAVRGATGGQTVNLSMVYALVWEDGDWKLRVTDPSIPIDVANIPDLVGYIAWGHDS